MKIAFCFAGLFRNFENIYPYIKKNILDPNCNNDISIFACTSQYSDKKYRFELKKHEILKKDNIETILKRKFGNLLKKYLIVDDQKILQQINKKYPKRNDKHKSRFNKIYQVLKLKYDYEVENNLTFDLVIFHRFDVTFTSWEIANNYYENKIKDIKRIPRGIIYKNNIPIGVEEHGCCCIQKYPPIELINTEIKFNKILNNSQIGCYEDYFIGHVFQDFFYCNSKVCNIIMNFYNDFRNLKFSDLKLKIDIKKNKSFQSYEKDNNWYLYSNHIDNIENNNNTIEYQLKHYLIKNNIINITELRKEMDIAVLYLR